MAALLVIIIATGVLVLAARWLFVTRRARHVETTIDGNRLSPRSGELHVVDGAAYRCTACRDESRDDERLRLELAQLDPYSRLAGIRADLQTAHDHLFVALGELELASAFWRTLARDLVTEHLPSELDSPDTDDLLLESIARVAAAKRAIHRARLQANSGPTHTGEPIVLPVVHWHDNVSASLHARVGHARAAARTMLASADAQLRLHFDAHRRSCGV